MGKWTVFHLDDAGVILWLLHGAPTAWAAGVYVVSDSGLAGAHVVSDSGLAGALEGILKEAVYIGGLPRHLLEELKEPTRTSVRIVGVPAGRESRAFPLRQPSQ
jgi:hypothetical protein